MASVEGLRRTGNYIKDVVGLSVGIGVYRAFKQQDNINEQLGQPKFPQIEKVMVTVSYALMPATILALSKEDNSSEPKKIHSKFKTGAKVLGALGIDLSTLAIPIAVSIAAKDPLPLVGIIGKPLGNAVVYLASDAMNARAFKRKDLPRGPEGTYDLLQQAYDESYNQKLNVAVIKDIEGRTKAVIRKEKICAESGGSCMVLYVPRIDDEKRSIGHTYSHVTEKDVVADIGAFIGGQSDQDIRPSIEELIVNLQKPEPTASS